MDHLRVVGVKADDRVARRQHDHGDARAPHERGRHRNPGGQSGSGPVSGPDVEADANRRRHAQCQGHHERDARHVEGDLVRGDGFHPEPADEKAGDGEETDFDQEGETDGDANDQEVADGPEPRPGERAEQVRVPHSGSRHHDDHHQERVAHHHGRRPAATHATHRRYAEQRRAVHEQPVEQDLERQRAQADAHGRRRPGHPLRKAAQGRVGEQGNQPQAGCGQVADGDGDRLFVDAEEPIRRFGVAQQQRQREAAAKRDPQRLPDHRPGIPDSTSAVQLGYGRRHRQDDSGHQEHRGPEETAAQRHPGQVRGTHSPRHHGVRDTHAHLRELGNDDRRREHAKPTELRQHGLGSHGLNRPGKGGELYTSRPRAQRDPPPNRNITPGSWSFGHTRFPSQQ